MYKNQRAKIGLNSLVNKFYVLHNLIDLSDLNLSMNTFKSKMKKLLRRYEIIGKNLGIEDPYHLETLSSQISSGNPNHIDSIQKSNDNLFLLFQCILS